jgi:putative ABC transport system permease protein
MFRDYFSLAFKNLKHRGLRSWLTLLGIFIGVAAVVSLISLGGGLRMAITSQFGVSSTEVISVQAGGLNSFGPPGSGVVNPLTKEDAKVLEELSTVEIVLGRMLETLRQEFNDILNIGFGFSVPEGDEARSFGYEFQELEAEQGRLLRDGDSRKIVVGHNFGEEDNAFQKAIELGDKIIINEESFRVVGILDKKGSFILDNAVMFNEQDLRDLVDDSDNYDVLAIKVKDKDQMDKAVEQIENLLRKRRGVKRGEEDFEVSTPQATLETINSILNGVRVFIVIIALISVFVGAVGIVNTMTTSVLERRKDIGIMKAVGARNYDIFMHFLVEAGLLGSIGGLVGILFGELIGVAGTFGINSWLGSSVGISIDYIFLFLVLVGSFLVGAVAGVAPAMKAARQNPVEALQG